MLEAAGYPNVVGSLSRVSRETGVPARTLSRWFNGEQNPPPDRMVNNKRFDVVQALKDEVASALNEMNTARSEASYRDLGVVVGILLDKQLLLEGKPTQRIENIATLLDELPEDEYAAIVEEARRVIASTGSGDPRGA